MCTYAFLVQLCSGSCRGILFQHRPFFNLGHCCEMFCHDTIKRCVQNMTLACSIFLQLLLCLCAVMCLADARAVCAEYMHAVEQTKRIRCHDSRVGLSLHGCIIGKAAANALFTIVCVEIGCGRGVAHSF